MIKIFGIDEGTAHHFFELLRIYYPSYEQGEDLIVRFYSDDNEIVVNVDFPMESFSGKFTRAENFIDTRNEIGRWMVGSLGYEGRANSPWGILTGVRPIKFTIKLLSKMTEAEAYQTLTETYAVDKDKAKEVIEIALRELKLTENLNPLGHSLYINIPFCPSRCDYCSYPTIVHYDEEGLNSYLNLLKYEVSKTYENFHQLPTTVYIGGGTPSVLNERQLEDLLSFLKAYTKDIEFTFEAGRPDTLNEEKIQVLSDFGVNRISINPQTMKQETLDLIGRQHSVGDIIDVYDMARKYGFHTINMDLILGLPGEDEADFFNSLRRVLSLKPENITVHTLSFKNGSKLFERNGHIVQDIFDIENRVDELCQEEGYQPYYLYRQKRILGNGSNTGYSLEGHECLYNVIMMEERESVLAMGMGSTSKIFTGKNKLKKFTNHRNMKDYKDHIDELIQKKRQLIVTEGSNEMD